MEKILLTTPPQMQAQLEQAEQQLAVKKADYQKQAERFNQKKPRLKRKSWKMKLSSVQLKQL